MVVSQLDNQKIVEEFMHLVLSGQTNVLPLAC